MSSWRAPFTPAGFDAGHAAQLLDLDRCIWRLTIVLRKDKLTATDRRELTADRDQLLEHRHALVQQP